MKFFTDTAELAEGGPIEVVRGRRAVVPGPVPANVVALWPKWGRSIV